MFFIFLLFLLFVIMFTVFYFIFHLFYFCFLFFIFLFLFIYLFFLCFPYFRGNSLNSRADLEFKEIRPFFHDDFSKKNEIQRFFKKS